MEKKYIYKKILEKLDKGILIVCNNEVKYINKVAKEIMNFHKSTDIEFKKIPQQLKSLLYLSREINKSEILIYDNLIEVDLFYIDKNNNKYIAVILENITSKIKNKIIRTRKNKFETLGELSLSIAHEIRNPLNIIRGFAQLIDESDDINFIKQNIKIIVEESNSLVNLANLLLKYGKNENIKVSKVEITSFIEKILVRLKIEDIVNIEYEDSNIYVHGDKEKLTQVALNIIKNGLESIENCSEKVFNIKIYKKYKYIIILFENSGRIEKHNNLKNLFIPFYTTKAEGTGLGLAISKKLIEKHMGKIYAIKNKYGGLTFKVILSDNLIEVKKGEIK